MIYAEASYFEGHPCQHVAAWEDEQRLKRIAAKVRDDLRHNGRRGRR